MAQRWTLSPAEAVSLERISTELARIGLVLPGPVAVRSYRCGKPNCACHAEASRLHGPYIRSGQALLSTDGSTTSGAVERPTRPCTST